MEGHIKKTLFLAGLVLLVPLAAPQWAVAQAMWIDAPAVATQAKSTGVLNSRFTHVRRVTADRVLLKSALEKAPMERTQAPDVQIQLPMPDGSLSSFYIVESPVMAVGLASKYPQIKTYRVRSVSDDNSTGRLDLGPNGFHAYISTPDGVVYIDPAPEAEDLYNSFYKRDYSISSKTNFSCGVSAKQVTASPVSEFTTLAKPMATSELLTYRIAVATTGEYSQAVAEGDAIDTLAEVVTAINRVNVIFERDLAIKLELISDNNLVIYTNALTDPYSNFSEVDLVDENQANLDLVLGSGAYDIGHVFSTGGGGLAGFAVVCNGSAKARGETGIPSPLGDPFYIDFVAHEIGHQFGANHTFNGTTDSCGGVNRNAATAYEPGSGTTIMAYAGICGTEDITDFSDAVFHAGTIEEVVNFSRTGDGSACGNIIDPTGNTAPVVNAGFDYTIPAVTPFSLTGSATDADGDTLLYQWDEMDAGLATTWLTIGTDLITNALFRSFPPDTSSDRTFPQLSRILNGVSDTRELFGETLATQNRTLNFRLTVRDLDAMGIGKGGVDSDDVVLTVDGNSGPFTVLQPNTPLTLDSLLPQVVEWNTACTNLSPVSCSNVDILLSTDGGVTFSIPLLLNTPNDGTQSVDFLGVTATTARLKIACTGNIFFDISDTDFVLANGSNNQLMVTGAGSTPTCNVPELVATNPGNDEEPNDFSDQAQVISIPFSIIGSVHDTTDVDDFFEFTSMGGTYTFTLSNYASNDLDLYLLDSSGIEIVGESSSELDPTESIKVGLANGQTYYIVVNGYDTSGQDVLYTLDIEQQTTTIPSDGDGGGAISYWLLSLLIPSCFVGRNKQRASRRIAMKFLA